MSRVSIVTGGTSGIGLATVRELRKNGFTVYEMSRRKTDDPYHRSVDISVEDEVLSAVKEIFDIEGHIDLLVNCAGFGISGAAEFTDFADAKRQLDVNFFGAVNMNKAVIPFMRASGGGRIISVSSVAAPAPIPFQAFYSASKAALNTYSLALQNEVRPFGISVCVVEPGDFQTGFTDARKKSPVGDDVYHGQIARSVSGMEKDERGGMKPEVAGKFICRMAMKKRVKPIVAIGFSYKLITVLLKLLPVRLSNYLIGKIYS